MTDTAIGFPVGPYRHTLRRRGDPHECPVDLVKLELRCRGEIWPLSRVIEALCRAGFRVGFADNLALVELTRDSNIRQCADACQEIAARPAGPCDWLPTYDHPDAPSTLH